MKIVLQKWGATWCGPCQALQRRGTLEKFADRHSDVSIEVHDDPDESGNESTPASRAWSKAADKAKIRGIPTLIWMINGEEVLRSDDVSVAGIEQQYKKVLKKIG